MKPYYSDDLIRLFHGDCRDILPTLEPADVLLTDPPYGIVKGAAVIRRGGRDVEDWGAAGHNAEVLGWREQVRLADDAWIVEFGAMAANDFLSPHHRAVGWNPTNVYTLVKQAPPPTPRPGFASAVELALISKRGKPPWHGSGYVPNRWIGLTPNRDGSSVGHPTQKPQEPIAALIRALASPGAVEVAPGLVIDPFAGSGTTLRAAKDEGRRCIGIEMEEAYCEMAARRLSQDNLFAGLL